MTPEICKVCKRFIWPNEAHKCTRDFKPHDCAKDGHVGKPGLISMFVCKHCGFNEELAPELQKDFSETEGDYEAY